MTGIHFIDRDGEHWMVLAGLPDAHPDAHFNDGIGPFTGVTFRASTGELRVLTRAAMRDLSAGDAPPEMTTRGDKASAHWEQLLQRAAPWPLA